MFPDASLSGWSPGSGPEPGGARCAEPGLCAGDRLQPWTPGWGEENMERRLSAFVAIDIGPVTTALMFQ